jgi:hypothetical protein
LHISDLNLYLDSDENHSLFTWSFYPLYESLELFDLLFNVGLTNLEMISFMKYKFGLPFYIKDEINIIWDLFINKKVFPTTLYRLDRGKRFSLNFSNLKSTNLNKKYFLLIVDLYGLINKEVELNVSIKSPKGFIEFIKNIQRETSYLKINIIK